MNFAAVRILCLAAILAAPVATGYAADVEGVQEHPMIERYPGQEIRWQKIENHMPYKVPAGPVSGYRAIGEVIETAGRVTRTFYVYEGADRTHTEIWKNYSDALKEAGLETIGVGASTTRPGRSEIGGRAWPEACLLYTLPSARDRQKSRMQTAG